MSEPHARERQIRQGWDNLSDELKREYGEEYLEKGMLSIHFLLGVLSPQIIFLHSKY